APALRSHLRGYVSPVPTLIDGRMGPERWIRSGSRIYKIAYARHDLDGAELDIVDPAYDLAAAVFEFRLTEEAEQELLAGYVSESGDRTMADRLLLYKLLYGRLAMDRGASLAAYDPSRRRREAGDRRRLTARDFLVHEMSRYCARYGA